MKVYVYTNNTRGRFHITPAMLDKLTAVGFVPVARYGSDDDRGLWRDESSYAEGNDPSGMNIPRLQGRLVIDLPSIDDEDKAWATARWKFYNALGRKNGPLADCDCCGASERFDTDDYYGDDAE